MTPSGPAIAPGGARRSVGLAANLTLRIAPRSEAELSERSSGPFAGRTALELKMTAETVL